MDRTDIQITTALSSLRRGRTAAAAPQPAPTLVLCTLTVAVRLLAARDIGIHHKASATALRVPAAPRA
eukprot:SAG31_NODE_29077_length_401_cov_0.821192_1_plen_67_part_10